jgi:titin
LTNAKTYTCSVTARNAGGSGPPSSPSGAVVPSANLPGAPTGVSAAPGDGAVSVSFTAPSVDGGTPILDYTASCVSSDGGAPGAATGAASPIVVSALTNAKTYTCSVTARNATGTSPASAPSGPVVPAGVPGAPTAVSAGPGNGTATVRWIAPAGSVGAPISGYVVTPFIGTSAQTPVVFASVLTTQTVTALANGTTYTFRVAATNVAGTGLPSAASGPVTVGAPAAPTAAKAVSGATTATTGPVTVSFTPGANNGATATQYAATCVSSNGGVTRSAVQATSPIKLSALTTAKTYTCTVKANNARGTGPPSAPSRAVTVGAPAAPTTVKATKVAAGSLKVTFTPGANNGSATTAFTVTCTSANGGVTAAKGGAASPIGLKGLTISKTYACTVKAINKRGPGAPSAPSPAVVT